MTILLILIAIGFVFLNAFFVAAEFSIVKIRHTRVQELEAKTGLAGRILAKVHHQLDAYLSACQLGITLASLGLGWIGEPAFVSVLDPLFHLMGVTSPKTISFLSFLIAFGFISYLHIVVGELMPKSAAIRNTEIVALWTAVPLYAFYWLMYPAISVLNASSNYFLKLFKLNRTDKTTLYYSPEEIKLILSASHRYGQFSKSELELLTKSLIFTDLEISDVMRPLSEMVSLDVSKPLNEVIQKASQKLYSRYPIHRNDPANITGILHIKDLLPIALGLERARGLATYIRPIPIVNNHENLLDLFHKFRTGKPHFAIVKAGNNTIGFLTLDNILQAIIGEVKDEFHITKEDWVALEDGSFLVKGSASIFTLETLLGFDFPPMEANTVGGFIMETLQGFPAENDKIEFEKFTLTIKKIRGSRILQVQVYLKK